MVMKPAGYCFVWTGGVGQAVASKDALHGFAFKGAALQVVTLPAPLPLINKREMPPQPCSRGRPVRDPAVYSTQPARYTQLSLSHLPFFFF